MPTFEVRGTVVDEAGTPVARAKVTTTAARESDVFLTAVTDAAGNFRLELPSWQIQAILLAKDDRGLRIASVRYVPGKTHPTVRIVLHPARTILVTVVDGKGEPIAAAKVGVAFALRNGLIVHDGATQDLTREQTDAKGQARLHLPADVPLQCVWAAKRGAGFDYVLYREPVVEAAASKRSWP